MSPTRVEANRREHAAAPARTGPTAAVRLARSAPLLLALAALCAYTNSFAVPFLFDDVSSLVHNETIGRPWPHWRLLVAPPGQYVSLTGRPVTALTFAWNRALGGLDVTGYHAVNLAIHVAAGLFLFGVVRRTLLLPFFGGRHARSAAPLAFAVALLWLVHPLQTKAVTFLVQRLESLMGLAFLAALYCSMRAREAGRAGEARAGRRFALLAVAACALGVGSKEVAFAIPLVVLLHDAVFESGGPLAALRARPWTYAGLFATWILQLALVLANPNWRVASEATARIGPVDYLLTQSGFLLRYLRLAAWPADLVFDYGLADAGVPIVRSLAAAALPAAAVLLLVGLALLAAWRRRAAGVPGLAFFLVLAPTTFVPIPLDPVAEHRMYLPLACVVVLSVLGLARLLERAFGPRRGLVATLAAALVAALALGVATRERNRDYASDLAIWTDTVEKRPGNARAHLYRGLARMARGDHAAAVLDHRRAIEISPAYAEAHLNLGSALHELGRYEEAVASWRAGVALEPGSFEARFNLAETLLRLGRNDEARAEYEAALRLRPQSVPVRVRLAGLARAAGRPGVAVEQLSAALALEPANVQVLVWLATTQAEQGRIAEAAGLFERALRVEPRNADAQRGLAAIRARQAR